MDVAANFIFLSFGFRGSCCFKSSKGLWFDGLNPK
jgi:hypothetical protein